MNRAKGAEVMRSDECSVEDVRSLAREVSPSPGWD
jgi:hypothetical protein